MRMADTIWSYSQVEGERREFGDLVGKPRVDGNKSRKNRNHVPKSYYAIPMAETISLAKWIKNTDDRVIANVVELEVESYPLPVSQGPGTVYSYKKVLQTEDAALVHILIVPEDLKLEDPARLNSYRGFFPSISFLEPPENSIALWLEDGKWVAGFSRNSNWVRVSTLGSSGNFGELVAGIRRIYAELLLKGLVEEYETIEVWTAENTSLQQELECLASTVRFTPRPAFGFPVDYQIVPNAAAAAKLEKRRRANRWLMIFGIVAFLILAGAGVYFDLQSKTSRNKRVQQQLALLRPEAAEISGIASQWASLGGAADPGRSPVEVLFLLSQIAGKEGIRFENFEMKEESVVVFRIQASSMKHASAFETKLESIPELAQFEWNTSPPKVLNNLVTFQCSGRLKSPESDRTNE